MAETDAVSAKIESMADVLVGKTTEHLLVVARLTEQAERFPEMCEVIKKLIDAKLEEQKAKYSKAGKNPKDARAELGTEERNMLSVAYKNVVGVRRQSWRQFKTPDDPQQSKGIIDVQYMKLIEKELEEMCREVLFYVEKKLLPPANVIENLALKAEDRPADFQPEYAFIETTVFLLKMCGDYYRYLAEFMQNDAEKKAAETNYNKAIEIAEHLTPTHPTRLGLILNASVCRYEILKKPTDARNLAKQGFDEAIQKLDSLSDANYKDSTLIMQLLRDNLTIWQTDVDQNNSAPQED